MTVSASSGTTPAQKVTCSGDANPQPQPFPNDLLWYMRQSYCSAGGCSDQGDECEVYVHGNGYRMKLTGSIPKDQSDTQFSQVCYDTTVSGRRDSTTHVLMELTGSYNQRMLAERKEGRLCQSCKWGVLWVLLGRWERASFC